MGDSKVMKTIYAGTYHNTCYVDEVWIRFNYVRALGFGAASVITGISLTPSNSR